ncbi:MAG: hypothetical protein AAF149_13700 [Bacteroidota bacterium]
MADNDIFNLVEKSHTEIILRVAAYAQKLIEAYTWFRGSDALPGGWSARDFALEAMTRLLENPDQFDMQRSGLTVDNIVAYLNRNIVRNLVRGARDWDENKKSDDLHDDDFEGALPFDIILMDEKVDVKTIKQYFEEALAEEEELYELFIGIYEDDLTRAEICKQLDIPPEEYDRRMKRFGNRMRKAVEVLTKG